MSPKHEGASTRETDIREFAGRATWDVPNRADYLLKPPDPNVTVRELCSDVAFALQTLRGHCEYMAGVTPTILVLLGNVTACIQFLRRIRHAATVAQLPDTKALAYVDLSRLTG